MVRISLDNGSLKDGKATRGSIFLLGRRFIQNNLAIVYLLRKLCIFTMKIMATFVLYQNFKMVLFYPKKLLLKFNL